MAPGLIAFDVNETLLSLEPIRRNLEAMFGDDPPIGEWFARLLHGSLVANTLGNHRPFDEIGAAMLINVAGRRGMLISAEDALEALSPMSSLPPHPDVADGLSRLARAGHRMVALTNGSADMAEAQIENAGLSELLERVISVDEVGKFKPDPAPYLHTSVVMEVPIGEVMLVAAHDWDCAGAMATGAEAVFVERPSSLWSLPTPPPALQVPDIAALADSLGA